MGGGGRHNHPFSVLPAGSLFSRCDFSLLNVGLTFKFYKMNKTIIIISIILFFSVLLYSCKSKTSQNGYCVTVVQNSPATPLLPSSELSVISALFHRNGMDDAKYQFYQLDTDDLMFRHVRCYQFVDNLKVFSEDLIFHFNQDDSCYLLSGKLIQQTGLNAKPSMHPNRVVEIFIGRITQEKTALVDNNMIKGCFEVELGYACFDDSNEKLTKVWKAKPKDKDYPFAYINDANEAIMYYDNGVRY